MWITLINLVITAINVVVLGITIKLYTELLKDRRIADRQEKLTSKFYEKGRTP